MVGTGDSVLIREVSHIQSVFYRDIPLHLLYITEDVHTYVLISLTFLKDVQASLSTVHSLKVGTREKEPRPGA